MKEAINALTGMDISCSESLSLDEERPMASLHHQESSGSTLASSSFVSNQTGFSPSTFLVETDLTQEILPRRKNGSFKNKRDSDKKKGSLKPRF